MKNINIELLLAGLATLILSFSAIADTPATAQRSSNIEFITGGIGNEERTSVESVKNDYNLHILSASTDGSFIGSTHLSLRNATNAQILSTDIGPIFYAKLPEGHYTAGATHDNQTKSEKFTITKNKPYHIQLRWE